VRLLHSLGYTRVRHYAGGLKEWSAHAADAVRVSAPLTGRGVVPRLRTARSASARFVDALADRSVAELFTLWLAIVVGCGVVYWLLELEAPLSLSSGGAGIGAGGRGLLSAVYFSAVTATSVGYGDIVPIGIARVLAIAEGVAGLILFGCVVSKFVSRRQEQLIDNIHHIAFEERLGRVRTNLLLVRAELQATARLCEGREIAPPEAVAHVESAAMVFVGELHAVHDLLHRPQQAPEEPVLEGILAGVTSVFREFLELLACVQARRAERTAALAASTTVMARLAREICGDCVPREYAPALRTWMDEIQRMAGDVEQI
jgi:potassium channel LctB